jgi:uncharacterized protein YjbI with pentapeptide repeats
MAKTIAREVIECLWEFPAALAYGIKHDIIQARICRRLKNQGNEADFRGISLSRASLPGVCLEGAILSRATITDSDLHGAVLAKADLSGADLANSNLHSADLKNANLSHAYLLSTNLQDAKLGGANLQWAVVGGTNLQNADLTGADLTRASIQHPRRHVPPELLRMIGPDNLHTMGWVDPNLAGADFTNAILIATDLIDADLTGSKMTGAVADARTRWPEGFDPQLHGVEVLPLVPEWRLMKGEVVLGALQNCTVDYSPALPWFNAHFVRTPAFAEVQPLFEEATRLFKATGAREEFMKAYQKIDALKLRLESPTGEAFDVHVLHIDGKRARFRY